MGLLDDIRAYGASYRLSEEAIYAEVLREMEAGVRRDGLWAMALAERSGSEARANSRYIQLRVQSLKDEIAIVRAASERASALAAEASKQRAIQNVEKGKAIAAQQADRPVSGLRDWLDVLRGLVVVMAGALILSAIFFR